MWFYYTSQVIKVFSCFIISAYYFLKIMKLILSTAMKRATDIGYYCVLWI